jgi:hypothetical protein
LFGVAAGLLMPTSVEDACVVLVIVASADPDVSSVDAEAVLSAVSATSLEGDLLSVFAGDCSSLSDSFLAAGLCAFRVVCTDFGAACALGLGCGQAAAPASDAVFIGQAAALPVAAALVLGEGFGCGSFFGAMWIAGCRKYICKGKTE